MTIEKAIELLRASGYTDFEVTEQYADQVYFICKHEKVEREVVVTEKHGILPLPT